MWTIFKVLIEFVIISLLLFMLFIYFFGPEACRILALQLGIEPTPSTLKGEVVTAGSPGKFLKCVSYCEFSQRSLRTTYILPNIFLLWSHNACLQEFYNPRFARVNMKVNSHQPIYTT